MNMDLGMVGESIRLAMVVPGRPPSPNRRNNAHWAPEARERRELRATARYVAVQAIRDSGRADHLPIPRVTLSLDFGLVAARGDLDNLVAGSKPIIDGLVDAGVIRADSIAIVQSLAVTWHRNPVDEVRIVVEELR